MPANSAAMRSQKEILGDYQYLLRSHLEKLAPQKLAAIIGQNFDKMEAIIDLPKGMEKLDDVIHALLKGKNDSVRLHAIKEIADATPKEIFKHSDLQADYLVGSSNQWLRSAVGGSVTALADLMHAARVKARMGPVMTAVVFGGIALTPIAAAYAFSHNGNTPAPMMDMNLSAQGIGIIKKQICTDDFMQSASLSDLVYATTFSETGNENTEYAVDSVMAGFGHGVDLFIAHELSYMETLMHTDMMANNSSATSMYQFIDSQKLPYVKEHGKDTHAYIQAKERIAAGKSTIRQLSDDKLLVAAVDMVTDMSREELESIRQSKNIPGYIFEALGKINNGAFASEIVILDIKKNVPEIMDSNLSPDQKREILAKRYYPEYHNLGNYNYTAIATLESKFPQTTIQNSSAVLASGQVSALLRVAASNPSLVNVNMTGGEALNSIAENFKLRTDAPHNKFMEAYNKALSQNLTAIDLCVTKVQLPRQRPIMTAQSKGPDIPGT